MIQLSIRLRDTDTGIEKWAHADVGDFGLPLDQLARMYAAPMIAAVRASWRAILHGTRQAQEAAEQQQEPAN